jgi:hypothetical protein
VLSHVTRVGVIQEKFYAHLELEHNVFDDGASATLTGGDDQDWYFETGVIHVDRPADVAPYVPNDSHEHSHATDISSQVPALEGFDFIDSLDKVADRQSTETLTKLIPHSDNVWL